VKVCLSVAFASNPETGGRSTFESQIFAGIKEFSSESKHAFVLFNKTSLKKPVQDILPNPALSSSRSKSFDAKLDSRVSKPSQKIKILKQLRNVVERNKYLREGYGRFVLHALRNSKVDVVLALTPSVLTMEIPFILIVWDLEHRRHPYFSEVGALREYEERETFYSTSLRRASAIITGTQAGKADIERFYQVSPERIKVLPFPTPHFALKASPTDDRLVLEKYNLQENFLFYPAQFWSHKNHIGLLLAVQWLRDQHSLNLSVVFAGSDKGNQAYVEQMAAKLNLSKQVYFLGFVPQEDLISLYRKAFALTFLTFFGPDNLPPLEAMALGCPVIASNVAGAQEQLGDAALLVDPKETEQIALAIKYLWDNEAFRQGLIDRGFLRANSWVTKDYINGLFSILDEFETIRRCWST